MAAGAFNQLAVIAQIAATLLGFIALLLVLSDKEWRFYESDKHFVQALVLIAAYTIVIALTPGALRFFMDSDVLWTLSLGIAAVLALASSVFQARVQLKMAPDEAAKIHWGWHSVSWGISSLGALLIVAGLLGFANPAGMFVGAMSVSVFLTLWFFVAVVYRKFF